MKLRSLLFALGAVSLFSVAACSTSTDSSSSNGSSSSHDGSAADLPDEEEVAFGDEIKTKTDKSIQEEIAAAAVGSNYTSESDYPFKMVSASLSPSQTIITQAIVREKLGWVVDHDPDTDKPLAKLNAMSETFTKWKENFANCQEDEAPGPADCAKQQELHKVLERNLRGIKVMYFGRAGSPGHVDGVGVTIVIVGRTPKGNLVGVRTIAIWT